MPIIVGVPRSGTTLLRMMLDAHQDLAIPPETHFVPKVAERCRHERRPSSAQNCLIDAVRSHDRWPEFHLDDEEFRRRIASVDPFQLSDGLRMFYRLYAEKFGKSRWGDKTPSYLDDMHAIWEVLPEARFIHVVRDGRDVALSIHNLWFGPNSVREAASWWVDRIARGRDQATQVPFYLEIRHEDLVMDTERTLRRVCDFIELPWDPVMLDYHTRAEDRLQEITARNPRPRGGPAISSEQRLQIHASTTKPPMPDRVAVWKREMSDTDQAWFASVAGDLLREFGYEVADITPPSHTLQREDVRR